MKIVMTASEAVPFAQSGGLGEVVSNLCRALGALGHEVTLIVPHYPQLNAAKPATLELTAATLSIPIGSRQVAGKVWESQLPASNVRVLLVEQRGYYDRPFLYHDGQRDFRDNCERFIYLSRAVPEIIRQFDLQPDVIHAHDWQTGLVPALLATEYRTVPACEHAVSVFTLHNLAYQGTFWHWDMLLTGLDWKYFNWRQMEFFGNLNLLKTGIVFADALTTVSPTYAEEIQTPEFGCGLHGVLRSRGAEITGILHGVDVKTWNPATDPYLPHNYSTENVVAGKAACKTALQRRLGLPERQVTPLAGMVAPLTDQNGFELLVARVDRILADDVQLVFLGDGDSTYRNWLNELAARNGAKVSASFGADDQLFHQIEAGADLYLMPSRFEPCGLNQMRSLIYGTVPVVRATGGLADTVVDATPDSISNQTANGFAFRDYDAKAFGDTMQRALDLYQDQPAWLDVVQTGMRGDWSWQRSAGEYVRVYEQTLARVGSGRALAGSRR